MDFAGNIFTQGKINDIIVQNNTKTSVTKVWGINGDMIQSFGYSNRLFTLEGFVTSKEGVLFLNGALNYTGSLYYSSSTINMELIGSSNITLNAVWLNGIWVNGIWNTDSVNSFDPVPVYFQKLRWRDDGKNPMIRQFSLDLVER